MPARRSAVPTGRQEAKEGQSVDPLADKYPGLSPYIYTNDNPLKFIDPDGRDFKMFYRKPDGDAGHIAIQVVDHNSGKVLATWSFGPSHDASLIKIGLGNDVASEQTKDLSSYLEGKDYDQSTIETDADTDLKAVGIIEEKKKANEKYNLYDNNCGTTAVEIINDSGVEVKKGSILPSSVFDDFNEAKKREEQEKEKETKKAAKEREDAEKGINFPH